MLSGILHRIFCGLAPANRILNTLVACAALTSFFAFSSLFFKSAKVKYQLVVPSLEPGSVFHNWIEPRAIVDYYDRYDLDLPERIRSFCDGLIQLPEPVTDRDTQSIHRLLPLFPLEEIRRFGIEEKLKMTSDQYLPTVLFEPWAARHGFSDNSGLAKEVICYAKEKMPEREYYQFILAYLYARRVENILQVTNVGNFHARNVKIHIRATQTLISGMKGSIISIIPLFPLNFDIDDYQAIIHIPHLKPHHGNNIHIVTREAGLFESNLSLDYETERTIRVSVVLLAFVISLISASLFALILGMGKSTRKAHSENAWGGAIHN